MSDPGDRPAPRRGVFSRALGVVVSPGETFRDVVSDPRPAGILFVACLLIGLATGLPQLTDRGRQAALEAQAQNLERFTGRPVTPEVYRQLEQQAAYGAVGALVGVFVMLPATSVLVSAVLWVVFNAVLGGVAAFKQVLAVVAHTQIIGALGALAAAPIQYVQGIQSFSGPFNLGALAPMLDPNGFAAAFLGGISVFTLWQVAVLAIGLAALYQRPTGRIAVGLTTAYLVIAAVVTAAVTAFMGGSR
jgi:hypothetical protein